ncbi:MAG: type I-MYXAN CRISPR-associated protein Cas6/Cmx6 [gamma proteobacterium symbiont of Bathyaustriella thionipta]|nr:type I-MYXAN CRISPR-associated protein Cas6/Cmx6 [gamma proteobacterium symbiont of Bathyaustriella thionipta]MCU7948530.1 type I-MYXAN CRISPR-associated protein Cas6/Cmx6 [gamma proteobacterium symbiont of Bathyaustriella thionipta]MCU7953837.1 type I-MYXAN CRISPR-associated protein Cas6/Cmx6 [gamma proteobacterium symbiont of Bathyaustriella thionipta]MCU7955053.1 type I-MYXAN CRISPR-associated protein Cas6/Cmx6 [gamma proteobacterium symbiont of Bathyaustriella thionipta]MCU7967618.1 type
MFWSEEEAPDEFQAPENVIDLSFKVSCKQIKLDHAWALTDALSDLLPWFKSESQAAIHHIYIPQSGNGWVRSDGFDDELIQLSRRTRLKIRIPYHKLVELQSISGKTISIDGNDLTFGTSDIHLLSTMTTIVARHVHIPDTDDDEEAFLRTVQQQINALDIQVRKMLCGKSHQLKTPSGMIKTRSLMIADISPEESIKLQENGIGEYYSYGCGVFIPQKGITAVNSTD